MSTTTLKRGRSPSLEPSPSTKRPKPLNTASTKFLIISDTHSHNLEISSFPACDVLLHCGDLTDDGSPSSIQSALLALSKIPAELKLLIAGNHEISCDAEYYASQGGSLETHKASVAMLHGPDSFAAKNGITYLDEGTHTFTLLSTGAIFTIYTSQWTPKFGESAFQYPTNEDRYNAVSPAWAKNVSTPQSRIPKGIDIVMTHGPPKYILDETSDGRSAGCPHLRRAIAYARPKMHCFGHIHGGYGARRILYTGKDEEDPIEPLGVEWVGKNQAKKKGYASLPPGSVEQWRGGMQTLMVNAAIEDVNGKPSNMPWLVEMDLEVDAKDMNE